MLPGFNSIVLRPFTTWHRPADDRGNRHQLSITYDSDSVGHCESSGHAIERATGFPGCGRAGPPRYPLYFARPLPLLRSFYPLYRRRANAADRPVNVRGVLIHLNANLTAACLADRRPIDGKPSADESTTLTLIGLRSRRIHRKSYHSNYRV